MADVVKEEVYLAKREIDRDGSCTIHEIIIQLKSNVETQERLQIDAQKMLKEFFKY